MVVGMVSIYVCLDDELFVDVHHVIIRFVIDHTTCANMNDLCTLCIVRHELLLAMTHWMCVRSAMHLIIDV